MQLLVFCCILYTIRWKKEPPHPPSNPLGGRRAGEKDAYRPAQTARCTRLSV